MLYQCVFGGFDDFVDYYVMGVVIFGSDFYFDQFVVFQYFVQFSDEGWGYIFVFGLQQGFQVVGLVVQEMGLGSGQGDGYVGKYG